MGAKIVYCHAEDEIPSNYLVDFKNWMEDRGFPAMIVVQQDHLVYEPKHIKQYLQYRKIDFTEIAEDGGELVKQIYRCNHSTARIV